ncbi:serine/threonine-protein kinase TOUSLED-like isoform X1 [Rutidosis leptorrhynchoides]|uniref:serine/threonine-protein kinase TOUSLED-like isoform X1 n=1 Tax=Rutidosis leptorrhynchoides TaxID=125765 RepID=UPI003A9A62CD
MSEDVLLHFTSNSSNQSDQSLPSKIAKLEARMVGKNSASSTAAVSTTLHVPDSQIATTRSSVTSSVAAAKFGASAAICAESLDSSDSEEDDSNGGEFLIQANFQKRRKLADDADSTALDNTKVVADAKQKVSEPMEVKNGADVNKKKHTRGRGNSTQARGRGSLHNDQTRSQSSTSNGLLENSHQKESNRPKEQLGQNERASFEEELASLRAKILNLEEELRKARQETSESQHLCQQLEKELKELKHNEQQVKPKRMKVISDLLISVSKAERQEARMKVRQDSLRLGNVGVIRAGTVISETWEDGQAIKDVNAHLRRLLELREAVERQRKSLKKKQQDKGDGSESESASLEEDIIIQDEIYKSRLASIKREEETYVRERDRYELEKGRLIREMKRIRDEDGSRFNNFQILNHRYALLNLLGKGGFSEVYKAFDLLEYRYVACKLHGLNAQWSEDKKQSYIRHAIREYNIHKTLVHHNIVRLWDIFEIDQNTFCTILEYCSGKDLDAVLKATPMLPEKEARIIICQIFRGLVYLNKRNQRIIHYDLKPGNVLFDELGTAKVTDFGLSKIVEDDVGSQGMELTSQGAGTYWYLPPECFELSKIPLISSKVDVWSAGILLYQMLFGRRPFGHDQTQERILREDTIIKARKVEFPSRPSVSNEAKEFIRRCLTYNQEDRPDVLTIALDQYLIYSKK